MILVIIIVLAACRRLRLVAAVAAGASVRTACLWCRGRGGRNRSRSGRRVCRASASTPGAEGAGSGWARRNRSSG